MPTIAVLNMQGQEVGQQELSEAVFGITPNVSVMNDMVKCYLANQRQGTQSALTRSEVSGGGRKPWRQKGTGRARQGSTRAPQWTHGGIALGPKPRDYGYHMNKKTRQLAIKSALSAKAAAGNVMVVDNLDLNEVKTKSFVKFMNDAGISGKALVVTPEVRRNLVLSARNVPGVRTTVASVISVYDILRADKFVVDKAAVAKIEEVYA